MADDSADTPRPLAEISHGPSAFEAFLERNQKAMIVLGITLVLATASWIVIRGVKDAAEKAAGAALAGAGDVLELQSISKDHPGTAAAGSAQPLIAGRQWESGDHEAAIATLRSFLEASPDHPAATSAKAELATRLAQEGNSDEAASLFEQLAADPAASFLSPYALIALGNQLKAQGKAEEAETTFKKAREGFAANPLSDLADLQVRFLRFSEPVEIEAPPVTELPDLQLGEDPVLPAELQGPLGQILMGQEGAPSEDAQLNDPEASDGETTSPPAGAEDDASEGNSN